MDEKETKSVNEETAITEEVNSEMLKELSYGKGEDE